MFFIVWLLLVHTLRIAPGRRPLDEALRVTRRRLIVTESVYRSRLERFWLDLLDGRLNRLRHGGRMDVPPGFRAPDGWRRSFESRGLRVLEARWLGSRWERLVHHPLLFVLEREASRNVGASG